jgi:hypothetical protein
LGGSACAIGTLFETNRTNFEAKGLPWLAVVTGEEVNDGELAYLVCSDLQDSLGLSVQLLRLKKQIFMYKK